MDAVGFSQDAQEKTFRFISAVLLLGNIVFVKRPGYHSDESNFFKILLLCKLYIILTTNHYLLRRICGERGTCGYHCWAAKN